MCLVDLNRSTLACEHAWFHLISPCTNGVNLSNCSRKLSIDGWEIKADFCPFCAGWPIGSDDFRLLGSSSRHASVSSTASSTGDSWSDVTPTDLPLSERTQWATGVFDARRLSRSGSISQADAVKAVGGPVSLASERNQRMHHRLESYMSQYPSAVSDARVGGSQGSKEQDDILADLPRTSPKSSRPISLKSPTSLYASMIPEEPRESRKQKRVSVPKPSSKEDAWNFGGYPFPATNPIEKASSTEKEESQEKESKWRRRSKTLSGFMKRKSTAAS